MREIVSAEDSDVKFITSDHPVTIYNHAVPPTNGACAFPLDPGIALRGSQTLYPMDRDHCLIITNLEYAKDPSTDPLQKRTFARNYRQSVTKIDSFIRERKLTAQEVAEINFIIKKRARRYIGGGRKEWLYPERTVTRPWSELRKTLMPPELGLFEFGGEIFVKCKSGDVHYQDEFEGVMRASLRMREDDPLAVLQEGSLEGGKGGGQMNMFKVVPNFEITMYLAQATGACIVTDSPFRWSEVQGAIRRRYKAATPGLPPLVTDIERSKFAFPQSAADVVAAALSKTGAGYPDLFRNLFKYLSNLEERGARPNHEAQLVSRFAKAHAAAQAGFKKSAVPVKEGRISCVFPPGGIQDNTVNRLLLMSSSERHTPSVPMAFFIEPADDLLVGSKGSALTLKRPPQ